MVGQTDLKKWLQNLQPSLSETSYGFGLLPAGGTLPAGLRPTGQFEEDEGTTLIAPSVQLAEYGIEYSGGWAKISLKVQSGLATVGLTAAITTALARADISANVIAGYHHDHIFVPWARRYEALAILADAL